MDHNLEKQLTAAYFQSLRKYVLDDVTTALNADIPLALIQQPYCFAINSKIAYLLEPHILFGEKMVLGMNVVPDPIETLFQAIDLFDTKSGQVKAAMLPRIKKYFKGKTIAPPYIFEFADGFIKIDEPHTQKKKETAPPPNFNALAVARPIIYDFFES